MIQLFPVLMAVVIGLGMWYFPTVRLQRHLTQSSTPLTDPILLVHVNNMAQEMKRSGLRVYIHEVPVINGLATPDGRVFITRGFLDRYKSGEVTHQELAGVIAHELGHVELGHTRRRLLDFSGQNAIRVVLGMVLGRFIPFIGTWLAAMVAQMIAARLSRQDEYEADAYAAALLTHVGLGTAPLISLFEKLDRLTGMASGPPAWLMNHPKAQDRIEAIRQVEANWRR